MDPMSQHSEAAPERPPSGAVKCKDCGTDKGVEVGPCPFMSEIHDDQADVALCVGCYGLRCDEI